MGVNCQLIEKGLTLVELIVVISLLGIVTMLAAPSFSTTLSNTRLTTNANHLFAALNLARSEAIKRGKEVVVRKQNSAGWEGGWTVFVDEDRTSSARENVFNDNSMGVCQPGEDCVLKEFSELPTQFTLRGRNNLVDFIRYTPTGVSNFTIDGLTNNYNDYFVLCDNADGNEIAEADTSRVIVVNSIGRPQLAKDTDTVKDGIPNVRSNTTSANVTDCTP